MEGKAEREGFEPPEACTSTVFKTAAFDRSAISPAQKYGYRLFVPKICIEIKTMAVESAASKGFKSKIFIIVLMKFLLFCLQQQLNHLN
jgi:hypothetical protein